MGRAAGQISLTPPRRLDGGDVGGFLVGLGLYVLALQYIRHGPAGPKAWLKAKFINEPDPYLAKGSPPIVRGPAQQPIDTRPALPTV